MSDKVARRSERAEKNVLPVSPRGRLSGELALSDNLSYRLSILNFLMGRETEKIYVAQGLTMHQWKVLSILNSRAPMPATDIARWVTLDKASISRAVKQLLALDLASRALHPQDARSVEVSLTPKGVRLYRRITARTAALQQRLLGRLPSAHVGILFACIDEIENRLREDSEFSAPPDRVETIRA